MVKVKSNIITGKKYYCFDCLLKKKIDAIIIYFKYVDILKTEIIL